MHEVTIFNNPEFGEIRTLETEDSKVLFCGKDVAVALGYKDTRHAVSASCRYGVKCTVPHPQSPDKTIEMIFIPESDVYRLAFGSKLPTAERFTDWVTEEVLPSIRKHGAYLTPDVLAQTIQNPDFLIGLVTELKAEQERRRAAELTVSVQSQQIAELQPKASYYDVVLNCKDLMSIGKIAKDFGKSAVWLNRWLHEKGIQYKQGGIWLLYQKYAEKGYTSTKTQSYNGSDGTVHSKVHTYWTQKGRLFLYDLLKENGFLPVIEQEKSA
ncbi:MAG: phage antirepressor KilAC domain-containing protein [Oscillospiraceae bacterium]|nr:phage antirepressor KilAC domain-containing protein [Oscillospiraceae bacterium]